MQLKNFELYRFFFPVGWLFAFWGAFLWIIFAFKIIPYPGVHHPEIMVGGFLLSFISGFLMTAIPKFTSSFPPTIVEKNITFIFTAFLFLSLVPQNLFFFRLMVFLQYAFLTWFVTRRFVHKKSDPPSAFLFVFFGLFSGVIGSLLLLTGLHIELGRLLYMQSSTLCFILGFGSRLVPMLLGGSFKNFTTKTVLIFGSLFILSFFIEVYFSQLIGTLLKNAIITLVAFYIWDIFKLPNRRGVQAWGLWLSCWSVTLGALLISFFPNERIHLLHLVFVSGIAMLTLMIGTRVTLSHGQHDMILESKSRHLQITIALFILAGLTRASAGFLPSLYESHLTYAALVFVIGLFVWGWVFLPKMISVNAFKLVKTTR